MLAGPPGGHLGCLHPRGQGLRARHSQWAECPREGGSSLCLKLGWVWPLSHWIEVWAERPGIGCHPRLVTQVTGGGHCSQARLGDAPCGARCLLSSLQPSRTLSGRPHTRRPSMAVRVLVLTRPPCDPGAPGPVASVRLSAAAPRWCRGLLRAPRAGSLSGCVTAPPTSERPHRAARSSVSQPLRWARDNDLSRAVRATQQEPCRIHTPEGAESPAPRVRSGHPLAVRSSQY